ncbi:hypothetical protein IHQ68_16700 [Chelatococcus sambhunathii]|uniref:Nuclease n=1 Tax=Chelatococcus sambhunathii TaxID=363953 RepID=A0ABU1DJI7_9HYPH|nr:hypothetical protein [Chelatococcus sambhunathii]MDR4308259.1 hypothetical protein [Chelatococcus sambhunathii]
MDESRAAMLGYRRASFRKAYDLLGSLRRNRSDLECLLELQKLLIREIMRAESKIPDLRQLLKANPGDAIVERRLEGYRHVAYIWRCFGDAIAFLYMDRYALKHVYYNTDKVTPKQSAGFLGKGGMEREIELVELANSKGVPAMLTDLTNTIRHGDVCLMGGPDPYLLEVKTSGDLNPRGKRQKRSIEMLQSFYETDVSCGLRGAPYVRRVELNNPELSYASEMAACIDAAIEAGHGVRSPEAGLLYIALTRPSAVSDALSKVDMSGKTVFLLNKLKSQRFWAPYYPFTLSLEDFEHLWAFSKGTVILMVAVDYSAMVDTLKDAGHQATLAPDSADFPIRFVLKSGELGAIGMHLLNRIGLEFLSPSTMALSSAEIDRAAVFSSEQPENGEVVRGLRTMPSPEAWLRGDPL